MDERDEHAPDDGSGNAFALSGTTTETIASLEEPSSLSAVIFSLAEIALTAAAAIAAGSK